MGTGGYVGGRVAIIHISTGSRFRGVEYSTAAVLQLPED